MRGVEGKTGKRSFGFSYALLAFAVVAYLGTWAYSSYAAIWKHPRRPDYGAGGRSLVVNNYYYLYTWVSPARCTLWAIPIGPLAEEANSYFLVLTPTDREKWKGPPLQLKEAATISGV